MRPPLITLRPATITQHTINEAKADLDHITPKIIDLKQAEDPVIVRKTTYLVACLDNHNLNKNNFVDATETIDLSNETWREAISMATYGRCEGCTRSWVLAV